LISIDYAIDYTVYPYKEILNVLGINYAYETKSKHGNFLPEVRSEQDKSASKSVEFYHVEHAASSWLNESR